MLYRVAPAARIPKRREEKRREQEWQLAYDGSLVEWLD
jgi:hypothetical protein